ncbi:MAG: hypothetical protein K2W96_12720, partial [Gemmataceae bacterium]|nr:hypothetical protein [Gemmataceae bacterium]
MIRLRAAFLLLLLAGLASAQEAEGPAARTKALQEGTHYFRRILHDHEFKPLEEMDDLAKEPKRTLLVALGNLEVLDRIPERLGGLEGFVRAGGAALLASDLAVASPSARQALIDAAHVSIHASTLRSADPAANCYRALDFCPFLQPGGAPAAELFQGTEVPAPKGPRPVVATNLPSYLNVKNRDLAKIVAWLPAGCVMEARRGGIVAILDNPQPFAAISEPGAGRVLAMADHSVFINEMMHPTDTKNIEFAQNCVRWLREAGGGGLRDRVLFLENGRPMTKLDLPMKPVRLPIDEMLRLLWDRRNTVLVQAEQFLAREENKGSFGPRLVAWLEENTGLTWGRLLSGAMVAASLAGVLYFAWRVGFVERFGHDRTAEPLLQAVDDRLPDRPLASQRVEAMLAGDAREPLRALAFDLVGDARPRA